MSSKFYSFPPRLFDDAAKYVGDRKTAFDKVGQYINSVVGTFDRNFVEFPGDPSRLEVEEVPGSKIVRVIAKQSTTNDISFDVEVDTGQPVPARTMLTVSEPASEMTYETLRKIKEEMSRVINGESDDRVVEAFSGRDEQKDKKQDEYLDERPKRRIRF